MPSDFVVLSIPRPDGERFAIFRSDDWFRATPSSSWGSARTSIEAMERFVESLELLPEEAMRIRLLEMGLDDDTVTEHLARARKVTRMNQQGGLWEVVTRVGYRNEEGQEVIARTARAGSEPGQRVFVMRCTVCDHGYGTNGCDIPHRRCPHCQDGPPGVL